MKSKPYQDAHPKQAKIITSKIKYKKIHNFKKIMILKVKN